MNTINVSTRYDAIRRILATLALAQANELYRLDPNFDLWDYIAQKAEELLIIGIAQR